MDGAPGAEIWFHHAGISVADLDASIDWWRRVLGFRLLRRYMLASIPAEIAMLANGPLNIELLKVPRPAPADPARKEPDADLQTCGNKHVCFSVADVRGVVEILRRRGADIVWVRDLPNGRVASFIRDNEGNLIELVEFPKVSDEHAYIGGD